MTPQELLQKFSIHLSDDTTYGHRYTTCPKCSADRKTAAHRADPVLGVTIDDKGVCWGCNHCGWTGPEKGNGHALQNATRYHVYTDEAGQVLYRKVRRPKGVKGLRFWLERPDGRGGWIRGTNGARKVLYRLPELIADIAAGREIVLFEGEKDVDNARAIGVPATCNPDGASEPDKQTKWRLGYSEVLRGADIVVCGDHDPAGYAHIEATASMSHGIARRVRTLKFAEHWPACPTGGDLTDWLEAGHSREQFDALIADAPEWVPPEPEPEPANPDKAKPPRRCLDDVHAVFKKWLGEEYDIDVIDAVLTTAAAERLAGDPLWLLVISGPGNAKTETVQALSGAGAHVTSTIASEGALLSATPQSDRSKNATGGLLRKIGKRGLLVIKDVTSILSSDRNVRGQVLAALREVYDGRWERNVGSDGGQTLTWTGRLAIVGAVTTAWDSAHAVVAACGDRFVLIRSDSTVGRVGAGNKAIRNTGDEVAMRAELAAVVGGVIAHIDDNATWQLNDDEINRLLKAADVVTYARTAVERDYQGNVIDAHAPEMPTRFAKQLAQMVRGGLALSMTRDRAMQLALRCARDSVPPLRMDILQDVAANPASRVTDVAKRITRPWTTVRRELEALHMLRLLRCDEERTSSIGSEEKTIWKYSLADAYDKDTLATMKREPPASSTEAPEPEPKKSASRKEPLFR
jgi:hypothetical protein